MRLGSGRVYREACCHGMSALLSTGKERDVVRGNSKWKGSVAGLGGLSGAVGVLSFQFLLQCEHLVPFRNERLVSNVPLCL